MLLDDLSQRSGQLDDLNVSTSPRLPIHASLRIDQILILALDLIYG